MFDILLNMPIVETSTVRALNTQTIRKSTQVPQKQCSTQIRVWHSWNWALLEFERVSGKTAHFQTLPQGNKNPFICKFFASFQRKTWQHLLFKSVNSVCWGPDIKSPFFLPLINCVQCYFCRAQLSKLWIQIRLSCSFPRWFDNQPSLIYDIRTSRMWVCGFMISARRVRAKHF